MKAAALDIGGANIKGADTEGCAFSSPFALWRYPDDLGNVLSGLLARILPADALAITMTGELCDAFETKADGVRHIVKHAIDALAGAGGVSIPVFVWTTEGAWTRLEPGTAAPLTAAASNWLALAEFACRYAEGEPALLIDIGSTTTDIIPLRGGAPDPAGIQGVPAAPRDRVPPRPGGRGVAALWALHDDPPRTAGARGAGTPDLPALPDGSGGAREVGISSCWPHKGRFVLKLEGVDSIDQAEGCRGVEIRIAEDDLPRLEEGAYYHHQLLGLLAEDRAGRGLGQVTGILETGGVPVLTVRGASGEWLIPFAAEFVHSVELPRKRIVVTPPRAEEPAASGYDR